MPDVPISYYRYEEPSEKEKPRRKPFIIRQLKEELHTAFEEEESEISLSKLVLHPLKTTKYTARQWFVSGLQEEITGQIRYELVWKDILGPRAGVVFKKDKLGRDITVGEAVQEWLTTGRRSAIGGLSKADVEAEAWNALRRQRLWNEMASFRRSPAKFSWRKVFGKKLVEERGVLAYKPAPLYKLTPKAWIAPQVQRLATARKAAREVTKRIAAPVVKAATKLVEKGAQVAASKLGATAGAAIGSAVPVVGTFAGWIAGEVIVKAGSKIIGPLWEITKICLLLILGLFLGLVFWWMGTVGAAFRPPEVGGELAEMVRLEKVAEPHRVDLVPVGSSNPIVRYTINFENLTEEEITAVRLVDDYDEENFTPSALGGGRIENGTLAWDLSNLSAGASGSVNYDGFVKANDGVDKMVVNQATLSATIGGQQQTFQTVGVVVVGNPSGQLPSGWPVGEGCITQGPYANDSHKTIDAIDIAPPPARAGTTGDPIYATHDGVAVVYYNCTGPHPALHNYVEVVSPEGFRSRYGHLLTIAVDNGQEVAPGQMIGTMGGVGGPACEKSDGVHVHYQLEGLKTSDYLPDNSFGNCVGRAACGCCFSNRYARCGE